MKFLGFLCVYDNAFPLVKIKKIDMLTGITNESQLNSIHEAILRAYQDHTYLHDIMSTNSMPYFHYTSLVYLTI